MHVPWLRHGGKMVSRLMTAGKHQGAESIMFGHRETYVRGVGVCPVLNLGLGGGVVSVGNGTSATSPALWTGAPPPNCTMSFEESRVFLVAVYSAVCTLGLPANCLTAWLTLLQALQGNVLAVYLFCLALCELLYIGTLPLWVIYVQRQHRWTLGPWACKVTAYIFFCNLYVSILFLCCVSCDRFVAVVYALESRGRRHQKTAVLVSASIFILVGLVHYPVFQMEDNDTCFETLPMNRRVAVYYYARFTAGFAAPMSIIAFTNQRIFRSTKLSTGLSATQKAKVKQLAIAVVAIFLFCFAPYHLVLLAKAVAFSYYRGDAKSVCAFEARLYTTSMVFLGLATVNSVADPIIYMLATGLSRQELCRIHKEWKKLSTKADVTKLTCSKDSEEVQLPTPLTDGCTLPGPVHVPGPRLGALERLTEDTC
ncbi:G-protein coupled receptor 132-like protein [Camelus ferus]|nr:G-protein coupled receptor 132-like protein [Camelus ferus]